MAKTDIELRALRGDDLFAILDLVNELDIADRLVGIAELFVGDDSAPVAPPMPREPATKDVKAAWEEYDKALDKYTTARGIRIGTEIGKVLISNVGRARGTFNALLASLTDSTVEEITALGLKPYIGLVKGIATHPDFQEAFSSAVTSETAGEGLL